MSGRDKEDKDHQRASAPTRDRMKRQRRRQVNTALSRIRSSKDVDFDNEEEGFDDLEDLIDLEDD